MRVLFAKKMYHQTTISRIAFSLELGENRLIRRDISLLFVSWMNDMMEVEKLKFFFGRIITKNRMQHLHLDTAKVIISISKKRVEYFL